MPALKSGHIKGDVMIVLTKPVTIHGAVDGRGPARSRYYMATHPAGSALCVTKVSVYPPSRGGSGNIYFDYQYYRCGLPLDCVVLMVRDKSVRNPT